MLTASIPLMLSMVGVPSLADSWPSPQATDTASENGAYVFRCLPTATAGKPYRPGTCRGMLFEKSGNDLVLCWERPLVNNICPVFACVSNSGKYVVTFAEWGNYRKLPIVVYGIDGELINVYGELRQIMPYTLGHQEPGLVTGEGLPHSISGMHWLSHALVFFGPKERFLIVRLSNKEVMVFQTRTGELVDNAWMEESFAAQYRLREYENLKKEIDRLIVFEALRLASSALPEERNTGEFVLSQCRDRKALGLLEQALKDPTSRIIDTRQGRLREYPMRKAARKALEAMGVDVPQGIVTEERTEPKGT